ncbi:MAG TPA: cell envelope integrity protein CreD, partial [Rhizomicrobium sp.]
MPLFIIQIALMDREGRSVEAAGDIASGWGGTQVIGGPMLFIPYEVTDNSTVDANGRSVSLTKRMTAVLLPTALKLDVDAQSGQRWRGIFPVPVYRAKVKMDARFDRSALAGVTPPGARVLWNEASAVTSISDVRGLADNIPMQVNGHSTAFEPGLGQEGSFAGGIHAPLHLTAIPDGLTLDTSFTLRGSRELSFAPLGQRTTSSLRSNWADPSFFGAFLPGDRTVRDGGFEASWTIPDLARGFGQRFESPAAAMRSVLDSTFGVRFYQPVDFYQLVQRSLKYAVLFVGLAFLVFFVTELVVDRRLHAAQYTLIGAAQVLFYLLLLSFAEHIGFGAAYFLAAAATVVLTALYALSAFASRMRALSLFGILSGLYALLYVILIQEDYALLIGALVLFFALGATMFVTRRIDWSRVAPAGAG